MFSELMRGFGLLIAYFVVCAASAILLRKIIKIPREVFRKTLHMIALGSVFVWTYAFETWWISALSAVIFTVAVFPILAFGERISGYSELLTERKQGEIKRSLVVVFGMFTILICVCWGLLGERYLVIASVLAWGLGDAAAALIGKRFGRKIITGKLVEGRKSLEGTLAMFAMAFAAVLVILLVNGSVVWYHSIFIAAVTAGLTAVVELYTKGGMDTITCPLTAAFVMIPLIYLFGGIGL